MNTRPLATVLRESVVIGGWVAIWRPLEVFLYDWWPSRGEQQVYDQLSRMPVRVVSPGTRPAVPDELPAAGVRAGQP